MTDSALPHGARRAHSPSLLDLAMLVAVSAPLCCETGTGARTAPLSNNRSWAHLFDFILHSSVTTLPPRRK